MTIIGDSLSNDDIDMLGHMHVSVLPESLISVIGVRYSRAFYRYIASSQNELVFMVRGGSKGTDILGACIVSLHPESLTHRLLLRTPVLLMVPFAFRRVSLISILKGVFKKSKSPGWKQPPGPEIILIFTVPAFRDRGVGSRLLERSEQWLAARGDKRLLVKTRDVASNRAILFYEKARFKRVGYFSLHGKSLIVFEKLLCLGTNIRNDSSQVKTSRKLSETVFEL